MVIIWEELTQELECSLPIVSDNFHVSRLLADQLSIRLPIGTMYTKRWHGQRCDCPQSILS
jgi:hypothetical protein